MAKALIIDDEKHCCDNLQWLLQTYCPSIGVAGVCNNAETGLAGIAREKPDLVFLDVKMPDMSGFEMLDRLPVINFDIIFTTAFDQYAIRAIRFGALDYLVKPIDKDELQTAVERFLTRTQRHSPDQFQALLTHLKKGEDTGFGKIAFPTLHGFELVLLADIVACESSSNYTNVYLRDGRQLLVSRTLKQIEEIIDIPHFFRIHHSYLVNLRYSIRYIKGEGGSLVLSDTLTVPVSRNKKEALLKIITQISP